MPATLAQLVQVRSQLAEEVLAYLHNLAARAAELPKYYPPHLRVTEKGKTPFDDIRQVVQVVEDRSAFEQWVAEERERMRAAGQDYDRIAYKPQRSLLEDEEAKERDYAPPDRPAPPPPFQWDEQAGSRFKRAVILGDPGFGKTWLLRYEARRLARVAAEQVDKQTCGLEEITLPIFVRLSELNRSDGLLEDALVDAVGTGRSTAFRRLVREKLATERCVILLDAWDEVQIEIPQPGYAIEFLPHKRQRLGQRLDAFARQFPQPHLLLTSRIVGYDQSPIPDLPDQGQVKELELLAFNTPQIESFVRVWFGDGNNAAQQFLAMLQQNHQVRELARIPLMLTLLCRVWAESREKKQDFPTRRVELYDRCLHGLLRDWKEEKEQRRISDVRLTSTLSRLARGAFQLHLKQIEQFTESELAEAVGFNLEHDAEVEEAEKFVESLKRDGILITIGERHDALLLFLHRTFQEFLAASALAWQSRDRGWQTIADSVSRMAWADEWRETIILLAGAMENPKPLLELLKDAKQDDYFRHRLCLAANCLLEIRNAAGVDPDKRENKGDKELQEIKQQIADEVIKIWWSYRERGIEFQHTTHSLPMIAQSSSHVVTMILGRLRDQDSDMRHLAAIAFGQMGKAGGSHPDIAPSLVNALNDEFPIRSYAADALGSMGEAAASHPGVLIALAEAALRDQVKGVPNSAARALGKMGNAVAAHPDVFSLLVKALRGKNHDMCQRVTEALEQVDRATASHTNMHYWPHVTMPDQDHGVRINAANTLGEIGEASTAHPEVLPLLINALRGQYDDIRRSVVEALEQIDKYSGSYQVARELLSWRPDSLYSIVDPLLEEVVEMRNSAARALGRMGEAAAAHPEVLPALIKVALYDEDFRVRSNAAGALGQMGEAATSHLDALPLLINGMLEWNSDIRYRAVEVLGKIGSAAASHPKVLLTLIELALHDRDYSVRGSAATALGQMGDAATAYPDVLPRLVDALRHQDFRVRDSAADALGYIGKAATAHPDVMPSLVNALRPGDNFAGGATRALGQMGEAAAAHPEVLPLLVNALGGWLTDTNVIYALGQMGEAAATHPKVLPFLIEIAVYDWDVYKSRLARKEQHWEDTYRRECAVEALGKMGKAAASHPKVLPTLIEIALRDQDDRVRSSASMALEKIAATSNPNVLPSLVKALRDRDSNVRNNALSVLEKMDTTATSRPKVLRLLVNTLRDQDSDDGTADMLERMMTKGMRIFKRRWGRWKARSVAELSH